MSQPRFGTRSQPPATWWMGSLQHWTPEGHDEPHPATTPAASPDERLGRDTARHQMHELGYLGRATGASGDDANQIGGVMAGLRAIRSGGSYEVPSESGELFDALMDNPGWDRYDMAHFLGKPEPRFRSRR